MPELVEVEMTCRALREKAVGARVEAAHVMLEKIVGDAGVFRGLVEGARLAGVRRRAKYIIIDLDGEQSLLVHLGMSGSLAWYPRERPLEKHVHVVLPLDNGGELRYRDLRQFGRMEAVERAGVLEHRRLRRLGPEPLGNGFTSAVLRRLAARSGMEAQRFLLDQSKIAGLGNIYAQEALFRARIHPCRPARELSAYRVRNLHRAIVETLREALDEGGTTQIGDGREGDGRWWPRRSVYGRRGQPCPRCGAPIERIKQGGRSTHFCPRCQR